MALSFGNNSPRGIVGLDLDGGFLAAVSTHNGHVERAVSRELGEGLMSDGDVVDGHGLAAAVKAFFRDEKLPSKVRLGVANQQIAVRRLDLPKITDEGDLASAVRFQAADAIAMPLEDAALDFQVVDEVTSPEGLTQMRLVVVAARNEMIARLTAAIREAGLKAEGIDLDAFALVRALAPAADPSGEARVYCHLGGVTNLAVAVGPTCLFTRTLRAAVDPGASPAPIAPAPAESSDPETATVEAAALAAIEAADEKPERARDPRIAALSEEIRLSIDSYMAQPDAREATQVTLSGPGSRHADIAEGLGDALGLPVEVALPFGGLDAGSMAASENPHRYTIAAGLALGGE